MQIIRQASRVLRALFHTILHALFFTRLGLILGPILCGIGIAFLSPWFIPLVFIAYWTLAFTYINRQVILCTKLFGVLTHVPEAIKAAPADPELDAVLNFNYALEGVERDTYEKTCDKWADQFFARLVARSYFAQLDDINRYLKLLRQAIPWRSIPLRKMHAQSLALLGKGADLDLVVAFEAIRGSPQQRQALERYFERKKAALKALPPKEFHEIAKKLGKNFTAETPTPSQPTAPALNISYAKGIKQKNTVP